MISVTITADSIVELAAQMASFFPGNALNQPVGATTAEVIDPPKKPRGRPAKSEKVIEGELVNQSAAEEPSESPGEPVKTLAEMRELIVAWVNDTAAAKGGGDEAKQGALGALRKEFGFQKVAEIPQEKFGAIIQYLADNPPVADEV